jgi:RNA polymerase sigma factor (sigma-70 family)
MSRRNRIVKQVLAPLSADFSKNAVSERRRKKMPESDTQKMVLEAFQRSLEGKENQYDAIDDLIDHRVRAFLRKRYYWAGPDFINEVVARSHGYIRSRLGEFKPDKGPFFTWAIYHVRNVVKLVKAEWYSSKFVSFIEEKHEQWAPSAPGPSERYEDTRRSRELWLAFDALPEDCRTSIRLHDREGLTFEETANRMGVTVGQLRGIRNRGLAVLKRRLQERGVSPVEVDSTPVPIWHGWDNTGYNEDWTETQTAVLPDGPGSLVGAAARDLKEEAKE